MADHMVGTIKYHIRPGRESDLDHLPAIERAAAAQFAAFEWINPAVFEHVTTVEEHRTYCAAGRLWVAVDADNQPVGFAVASVLDDCGHLEEIDVHPAHGRRGIGRALIEQVCAWARTSGYAALTLTTERDVPWNAPYYARLGFAIIPDDDLSPGLDARMTAVEAYGLQRATRVAMIRQLQP